MRPGVPLSIKDRILSLRGMLVMLDRDLAALYGVRTRHLNQQVKRNQNRFPSDFMFQLTAAEAEDIRVLGSRGSWHGKLPYAFTELGAGMLAAVLRSPTATKATIHILRVFRSLRAAEELAPHSEVERQRLDLFHAVRDAFLYCPEDKPFHDGRPLHLLYAGREGRADQDRIHEESSCAIADTGNHDAPATQVARDHERRSRRILPRAAGRFPYAWRMVCSVGHSSGFHPHERNNAACRRTTIEEALFGVASELKS